VAGRGTPHAHQFSTIPFIVLFFIITFFITELLLQTETGASKISQLRCKNSGITTLHRAAATTAVAAGQYAIFVSVNSCSTNHEV
jgi:hypothetical protein